MSERLYLAVYFIFEDVDLMGTKPPERLGYAIIETFCSCSKCTVNKLEGVVSIHGGQDAELERRLVVGFVKTGWADIILIPSITTPKAILMAGAD